MKQADLILILTNHLTVLQQQKHQYYVTGELERYLAIDIDIADTETLITNLGKVA